MPALKKGTARWALFLRTDFYLTILFDYLLLERSKLSVEVCERGFKRFAVVGIGGIFQVRQDALLG